MFPYAVKNGNCEIYFRACVYNAEKGDYVIMDSDKRSLVIIKKDTAENIKGNLTFVGEEINYIKEYSKLKFQ